jgi:hypothetical protein
MAGLPTGHDLAHAAKLIKLPVGYLTPLKTKPTSEEA